MFSRLARELHRFKVRRRSLAAVRVKNPDFGDLEKFCADYAARTRTAATTQSLDLGCGTTPRNPFNADTLFGVDIREDLSHNVKPADLAIEPIPFADSSFDYITAFDFLEHVPRVLYAPAHRFPFVVLMNEIHRTLKPGGVLLSHTPAYPYTVAFQDPTHVNIIAEDTFPCYFDDRKTWARPYGFVGAFEMVRQGWNTPHLISVLRKAAS